MHSPWYMLKSWAEMDKLAIIFMVTAFTGFPFPYRRKKNVLQMTPKPAWNRTTACSHTAFSVSRISRLSFMFFFCWQWVSLLPVTPALMQSHLLIEWHSILIHNCLSISKFIDFSLFRSLGNSVSLWHICLGPSTMIMSIYSLFSFFFGCLSFGIKIWTIWTIWPSVT